MKSPIGLVRVRALSIFLLLVFIGSASAAYAGNTLSANDLTEGGHLETDTGAHFLAEWWYLNGHLQLEAQDGEKRSVGWFAVMGHQESPLIDLGSGQLSHILKFSALYDEDGTNHFVYNDTYIPRAEIYNTIGIHKPYLMIHFPQSSSVFFGAAATGYTVNDQLNDIDFTMFFKPDVEKTLDQSEAPLNFTTYEYANGNIGGTITLDGKQYFVKKGNAYFDHMIPTTFEDVPWPVKMNGWSWAEVTTKRYQAVIYAIRSLADGFDAYSYKHLTIIDRDTGEVKDEFDGNEVQIIEGDDYYEPAFGVSRPQRVTYKAGDYEVSVYADAVVDFDRTSPLDLSGFVDFMAYQRHGASIKRNYRTYRGNAFYEYLVSDAGAAGQH